MKNGLTLIGEERVRQRGPQFAFTDAHDDAHTDGQLVDLAEHYLDEADPNQVQDYGRNLIKAGAAIAAELDRVIRATGGTVAFATQNLGIHQTGGDPDNRDGSQANAQAGEPVRTPVGRDDNKDGSLAGGNKPVLPTDPVATEPNTPPSKTDKTAKATQIRAKATAKAKTRSTGRHGRAAAAKGRK